MLLAVAVSCNNNATKSTPLPVVINYIDKNLQLVNGIWLLRSQPFSGEIKEMYPTGNIKSLIKIVDGKQEGIIQTFYETGKIESIRYYKNGEKDGENTGWWPNGNKKFEYHFTNGVYNGLFTEWYIDGHMIQQIVYVNGKDIEGKGWRDDGKVYMSFVVKDGRRYGLMNSNLCYSLNRERIKQ
jgi:antitoxin component YwqK of YwqJK toxin-antitoxin module